MRTRKILILLLLMFLLFPFTINAEDEDIFLDETVTTASDTIYSNEEYVLLDSNNTSEVSSNKDSEIIDDEEEIEELKDEEFEFATKPESVNVWIYLVVISIILLAVLCILLYAFYKIYATYSSVLEKKSDDDTESIITVK